ncbi:MAG: LLM class flavin-dependent oxidoreductase [Chloroflexi bacterium]|nr:LLM class flavin-dependent oxidoreductase [Chloroflexota bacterium]
MRFDCGLYAHGGETATYPQVDEWRAEARLLEDGGFTGIWVAEHHFFWDGWVTPTPTNPTLAGVDIAAHTTKLRIGQCGVCLTDRHPIHVAEDIAMLDHMSKGRVDFGIIKGINNRVNSNFNVNADRRDKAKNSALFEEAIDIIIKCWTEEAFSHTGEFYTLPMPGWKESVPELTQDRRYHTEDGEVIALGVLPKPYQKPHPPIWQMADSIESYKFAAGRGFRAMSWGRTLEGTRDSWTAYREVASRVQGREVPMGENVAMMRPIFVAKTQEEAEKIMRPAINGLMNYGGPRRSRKMMMGKNEPLTDADLEEDWFDFLTKRGHTLVGTPEFVVEEIERWRTELGCEHVTLFWPLPFLTFPEVMRSLYLFSEQVIPRFQAAG